MAKISKREKENKSKVEAQKFYALNEAVELVKALANAKFNESVDIAVQLGIDPRKSDQAVRGSVVMPAGTGKTVRVAVFAQGAAAEAAKEAGADIVGMEDLAHEIKGGKMDFDVVIAEPAAMRVVGQLGQILGPRGLMPNPKSVLLLRTLLRLLKTPRPVRFSSVLTKLVSFTLLSAVLLLKLNSFLRTSRPSLSS